MTCEIAIMNLNAVTLAADSAMTVTRWVNGERQRRYFKGSNKIFQVSNHQPVGLMVYGSASVQSIPWELAVKEFRAHLKTTSYPSLKGYAEALCDYLHQHPSLFPPARRLEIFLHESENTALALLTKMTMTLKLADAPSSEDEKKKVIDDHLSTEIAKVTAEPLPKVFTADADKKALADHSAAVTAKVIDILSWMDREKKLHPDRKVDAAKVGELAVLTLYRKYKTLLSSSGIVIAGFGELDIFPAYHEYLCYGFLLDDFVFDESSEGSVSLTQKSLIKPFATTDMVNTFLLGFNEDVYEHVMKQFERTTKDLLEKVKTELKITDIPNVAKHIKDSAESYQDAWTNAVADDHFKPLREVVSSLPVDEMANLASTLVMLQSLKEKVTSPTESVGGPIDVAIITKHEGLIWISRKHYFDPKMNSRYFLRQQAQLSD